MMRRRDCQWLAGPFLVHRLRFSENEVHQTIIAAGSAFAFQREDDRKNLLLGDLVAKPVQAGTGAESLDLVFLAFDDVPDLIAPDRQNGFHRHQVRFTDAEMRQQPVALPLGIGHILKEALQVRPHRVEEILLHRRQTRFVLPAVLAARFVGVTGPNVLDHRIHAGDRRRHIQNLCQRFAL
ncbi:MAG TPA: hypothetical protein VMP11_03730 [Verrucomicrobiae bacterium]|nr:hypothetical protein [Verrucomicrobiae bacterium]